MSLSRAHPRFAPRTLATVAIWGLLAAGWNYITNPHQLPGQASLALPSAPTHAATSGATGAPVADPSALAAVEHAQRLPDGPTGQLLPPGTMAPSFTYPNSYSKGQCTWYVAGRRQIPSNWGNAASWYYHAVASGWAVGTVPAIAAIAWTPSGSYGHVALVEQVSADGKQVYISEMNYRGVGVISNRWVGSSAFKYIY